MLSVEACKARLHLAEGKVDAAMGWAEDYQLSPDDALNYNVTEKFATGSELAYLTYARVLVAYGQQTSSPSHWQSALHLLNRLQTLAQSEGRTIRLLETLLLQALIWQGQGDRQRSLDLLQQALNIPRRGNYVRLFLDEGKPMAELLTCAASRINLAGDIAPLLTAFAA